MTAMWRENRRITMLLVVAFAVAGCTNATADTTTTVLETTSTTAAQATTTAPPSTTTTSETTTTTATTFTEPVGSPEALADEIEEVRGFLSVLYSDETAASIPSPDLTNPDPVTAIRELLVFEISVIQIATVREYADLMAVPASPAYGSLRRDLDTFENNKLRMTIDGEYEIHAVSLMSENEGVLISGPELVDDAPEGSVFVAYETSLAPYVIVREDGTLVQEEDGWEHRNRVAIISPTASGWKYFWVET